MQHEQIHVRVSDHAQGHQAGHCVGRIEDHQDAREGGQRSMAGNEQCEACIDGSTEVNQMD